MVPRHVRLQPSLEGFEVEVMDKFRQNTNTTRTTRPTVSIDMKRTSRTDSRMDSDRSRRIVKSLAACLCVRSDGLSRLVSSITDGAHWGAEGLW